MTSQAMTSQAATSQAATSIAAPRYALVRPVAALDTVVELKPDGDQRRVIEHSVGPLLVLAGPGTGKTTTLRAAVTERITCGADPYQVLMLTFGRRARAMLRHRITSALPAVTTPPMAHTFHSYAFGLLRAQAAGRGHPAPRLLSGPEQDLLIRELLAGDAAGTGVRWPRQLRAALRTRGFATALRDLISRAYERGIDPVALDRWGVRQGRTQWRAAAAFMQQYADVTELRDAGLAVGTAYDPAELIRAAITALRRDRDLLRQQRRAYAYIYVDEYHDCDPAQEELLQLLVGGGRCVVVFADPDQSIYGFRGAEPEMVRRFAERFTTAEGGTAPTQVLRTCHRSDPILLPVFGSIAARIKGPVTQRELHPAPALELPPAPSPQCGDEPRPTPGVRAHVLPSAGEEAALIAAELRQAPLVQKVPWEAMAVVVRSASSLAALRRTMLASGVPVGGARSLLPLAEQSAAAPLLWLLQAALAGGPITDTTAEALLLTELGGGDPVSLRRFRQALRARAAARWEGVTAAQTGAATAGSASTGWGETDSVVTGSGDPALGNVAAGGGLLAAALADTSLVEGIDSRFSAPVHRVARLMAVARRAVAAPGATAETVLWEIWNATGLARRWQARSAQGGTAGATADRDLDVVIELFDTVARFCDRLPGAKLELFAVHLRAQQLPADVFASDRLDVPGVRLLTAHAAKGLEWGLVVVAGVQEELWPDLRLRGGVLGAGDLVELAAGRALNGPAARAAAYQQLLDEVRRLFYVAVTRARHRLVVTAVDDEDNQPSRFLDDIVANGTTTGGPAPGESVEGGDASDEVGGVPPLLSLPSLVARLRRAVTAADPLDADTASSIKPRRRAAAALLSHLAAGGVPGAHPEQWWGLTPVSDTAPLIADPEPVPVSPSAVEVFSECGLRWLLERRVGGSTPSGLRQQIGLVVHEIAAQAGAGASAAELRAMLHVKLQSVDLGEGWMARRERKRAEEMVDKLAEWFANNPHRFLAAEQSFEVEVGRALLRGRVDRLELDEHGRLYVVDFKTGATPVALDIIPGHPQLGSYQLAVGRGGFGDDSVLPGGAALVQLGTNAKSVPERSQLPLTESQNPQWPVEMVMSAADGMAAATFVATQSSTCRRCPVRSSCPLHSNQTTEPPLPDDDLEASE